MESDPRPLGVVASFYLFGYLSASSSVHENLVVSLTLWKNYMPVITGLQVMVIKNLFR